jgi:hypothetical protein
MTKYLYDTQDNHILGYNVAVIDAQPTRFREATDDEIDAHFAKIGKPREFDAVAQRKLERAIAEAERETAEKEKLRERMEHKNFDPVEEARQAEIRAKRVAALAKGRAAKKAKEDAARADQDTAG